MLNSLSWRKKIATLWTLNLSHHKIPNWGHNFQVSTKTKIDSFLLFFALTRWEYEYFFMRSLLTTASCFLNQRASISSLETEPRKSRLLFLSRSCCRKTKLHNSKFEADDTIHTHRHTHIYVYKEWLHTVLIFGITFRRTSSPRITACSFTNPFRAFSAFLAYTITTWKSGE